MFGELAEPSFRVRPVVADNAPVTARPVEEKVATGASVPAPQLTITLEPSTLSWVKATPLLAERK